MKKLIKFTFLLIVVCLLLLGILVYQKMDSEDFLTIKNRFTTMVSNIFPSGHHDNPEASAAGPYDENNEIFSDPYGDHYILTPPLPEPVITEEPIITEEPVITETPVITEEVTPSPEEVTPEPISAAEYWKQISLPPTIDVTAYATSKECTDALYQEANAFFASTELSLPWKNALCVGDSITLGMQANAEEPWPLSYPQVMNELYGIPVENQGVGSSTIWGSGPYSMSKRIVDYGSADAVFIMGGLNDWFFGNKMPMGDLNSPITFIYDLNVLFQHLQEQYGNSDIFIIIPMNPAGHMGEEEYDDFDVIRNAERNMAAQYGYHIIDLAAMNILSGLDPATKEAYYSDICHPNTMGYEILGTIISYEAIRIMCESQQ